jgi:hypothetical protein
LATEDDRARAERRGAVKKALRAGLHDKLLLGGSGEASAQLQKAYQLARKPTPLQWPWPQLTAFRLAYVWMRTASSSRDLAKIDRLLREAGDGVRALDPLQHALHIIVLRRRLELAKTQKESDVLRARTEKAFDQLRVASRDSDAERFERAIQDDLSSLVELLAFLIGRKYQELEGLGRVMKAQFPESLNNGCVLVSNQGDDHRVRLTRHLAWGEFETRIAERSVDLAFKWEKEAHFPKLVYPKSKALPNNTVSQLLPDICLNLKRAAALDTVEKAAPAAALSTFDVNLQIIRKMIAGMLDPIEGRKLKYTEVIIYDKLNGFYAFHPRVRVLGLVDLGAPPLVSGQRFDFLSGI